MSSATDKALIKKYLDGQCTPEELQQVRAYLKNTPNARQLFDEVWDEEWSDQINPDFHKATAEQKQRWREKFNQKVYDDALNATPVVKPFYKRNSFWKYAAIWLVIFSGFGIWRLNHQKREPAVTLAFEEKANPRGQRSKIVLADGSVVYLGALSKLRFEKSFEGNTREVDLEGEAFFQVTKNPHKPFIIHTHNVSTRVLGTSFKIDAFAHQPIKVLVSTGKVRVDRKGAHGLEPIATLLPGDAVTWNETLHQKSLDKIPVEEVTGWAQGQLYFRSASLREVVTVLERWYDVKIDIKNDALAHELIKVNLTTNISIEKVMNILSAAGNFKYKMQNNQITINR